MADSTWETPRRRSRRPSHLRPPPEIRRPSQLPRPPVTRNVAVVTHPDPQQEREGATFSVELRTANICDGLVVIYLPSTPPPPSPHVERFDGGFRYRSVRPSQRRARFSNPRPRRVPLPPAAGITTSSPCVPPLVIPPDSPYWESYRPQPPRPSRVPPPPTAGITTFTPSLSPPSLSHPIHLFYNPSDNLLHGSRSCRDPRPALHLRPRARSAEVQVLYLAGTSSVWVALQQSWNVEKAVVSLLFGGSSHIHQSCQSPLLPLLQSRLHSSHIHQPCQSPLLPLLQSRLHSSHIHQPCQPPLLPLLQSGLHSSHQPCQSPLLPLLQSGLHSSYQPCQSPLLLLLQCRRFWCNFQGASLVWVRLHHSWGLEKAVVQVQFLPRMAQTHFSPLMLHRSRLPPMQHPYPRSLLSRQKGSRQKQPPPSTQLLLLLCGNPPLTLKRSENPLRKM